MAMVGRYYFNLVEDERTVVDEVGLELESESDVHSEAQRSAQWIAASYGEGRRPTSASVRVEAATGEFFLEVPINT
jgi:hypothetical protein